MMHSVRWCGLLGFCISALVHLVVAATIFRNFDADDDLAGSEHRVPVTLAMLDLGSGPELAPSEGGRASAQPIVQQPAAETEVEPEADSEPETNFQPAPEPELDPQPMVAQRPEPRSEPKPKHEIVAESKSEPQPKAKAKTKPQVRAQSKPIKKPKSKPRQRPGPVPRRTPEQVDKIKAATLAGGSGGSAKGGGNRGHGQNKALEKEYLAGLRQAIAKKRRYPTSARRTGKTGVATVEFVLDRNGRISGSSLGRSSGSSVLDQAAVDTLRRLARYKPIPEALGRTRWRLRVPIRFALE